MLQCVLVTARMWPPVLLLLLLSPSPLSVLSLLQNWGKELKLWLGERVVPVVVDDTRADDVKKSFQV